MSEWTVFSLVCYVGSLLCWLISVGLLIYAFILNLRLKEESEDDNDCT